jgi:hypothetical protein
MENVLFIFHNEDFFGGCVHDGQKRKEIEPRSQAATQAESDPGDGALGFPRQSGIQLTHGMVLTYRTRFYHLREDGLNDENLSCETTRVLRRGRPGY